MPVIGHMPDDITLVHAIKSGMYSIEHLYGFVNPYRMEKNLNDNQVKKACAMSALNNVWNCPTLVANDRIANIQNQREYENEKQMDYISSKNKKAMRFLIKESGKVLEKAGNINHSKYMERLFFIVNELRNAGASILLGTDKAVSYVVAGFSEHQEMMLLSQAELTNYEIISAATINAAKCLKIDKKIGTIEIGKKANLILTEKNPLEDLNTLSHHVGVVKSGTYYSRELCDKYLVEIKNRVG